MQVQTEKNRIRINWEKKFESLHIVPALLAASEIAIEHYPALYKKLEIFKYISFTELKIETSWQLQLLTGDPAYFKIYLESNLDNLAIYAIWSGNVGAFQFVKEKKPEFLKIQSVRIGMDLEHFAVLSQNIEMLEVIKPYMDDLERSKPTSKYNIAHLAAILGWSDGMAWINKCDPGLLEIEMNDFTMFFDSEGAYIHHYAAAYGHLDLLNWMKVNKPQMLHDPKFNTRINIPECALLVDNRKIFNAILQASGLYYSTEFTLHSHSHKMLVTLNKALDTNFNLQKIHVIGGVENLSDVYLKLCNAIFSQLKRNRDNIIELDQAWPGILALLILSHKENHNISVLLPEVICSIIQKMLPKGLPKNTTLPYYNHFLFKTEQTIAYPKSMSFADTCEKLSKECAVTFQGQKP